MGTPEELPSDPAAADAWVNEIIAREQVSRERQLSADVPKQRRSLLPILIPVAVVAAVLAVWNPGATPVVSPKAPKIERVAASALSVQVAIRAVEAYTDSTGRLPASLADVLPATIDVKYQCLGDGSYRLQAGSPGNEVEYVSSGPAFELDAMVVPALQEAVK